MTFLLLYLTAVLILVLTRCWIVIPAYMGRLIQDPIFKNLRALGGGLHFLWPWEIPVENSDSDLQTLKHDFQVILETGSTETGSTDHPEAEGPGEPVPLNCDFTTIPSVGDLLQFRKFKKEDRIKAITENLKSFLTSIQKDYSGRQDLMDKTQEVTTRVRKYIDTAFIAVELPSLKDKEQMEALQETVQVAIESASNSEDYKKVKYPRAKDIPFGMNMRQYYGVSIPLFIIGDVEQPDILKTAIIEKEAVEQKNLARKSEMDNQRERANDIMKDAKVHGSPMPYETAMKQVQMKDGGQKISEQKTILGLEAGTVEAIKEVLIHVFGKK